MEKKGKESTVVLAFRSICIVFADVENGAFDGDEGGFVGSVSCGIP